MPWGGGCGKLSAGAKGAVAFGIVEEVEATINTVLRGGGKLTINRSEATFLDLPAGLALTITVTARNDEGGESASSEAITADIPG